MTLSELLEELRFLDVDAWSDIDLSLSILINENSSSGKSLIQGCIQQACKKREWRVCSGDWNGYHEAYIFYTPINCAVSIPRAHDSLAEALLAAYIAAVKGEKK